MSEIPYIANIIRNAKNNIAEQKLNTAYSQILEGLKRFPYNKALRKLRQKCEKLIKTKIKEKTKNEIKNIKNLFTNKKYELVIKNIEQIFKIAPNNQELIKFYTKAKEKLIERKTKEERLFLKQKTKEVEEEYKKDEELLLRTLVQLEQNHSDIKGIKDLINNYRDKIIEKKIKEKKDLLMSTKFIDINHFIETLEKIDKTNIRYKKIKNLQHAREFGEQISERSDFIEESIINIKTLLRLKKYNEALIAINEIAELTPNFKKIIKLKTTTEKKLFKVTKKIVIKQIKANKKNLKKDYQKRKKEYKKI